MHESGSVFNNGRLSSWIIAKIEYTASISGRGNFKMPIEMPAVPFANPIANFTNPLGVEFLFIEAEVEYFFAIYFFRNSPRLPKWIPREGPRHSMSIRLR